MPRHSLTAHILQTLMYYDGPQILLLRSSRDMRMIAAAVEHDAMTFPFFVCDVVERDFRKYMHGKADLHYLYKVTRNHYFFDLATEENMRVSLRRATSAEIEDDKYYPDPGFFARSHTELVEGFDTVEADSYVYNIEGSWDASDFSRFYSNIEDVYSVLVALAKMTSGTVSDKADEIRQFIEERFWQGGGSYVGFYDSLFDLIRTMFPLRMGKLRYASPGEIEVRGDGEAFSDINALVATFDDQEKELSELYNSIDGVLGREHLRRASADTPFSGHLLEQYVKDKTLELSRRMDIEGSKMLSLCNNNTLVFSKVVLSFYRRAKILYVFHAEGRVRGNQSP